MSSHAWKIGDDEITAEVESSRGGVQLIRLAKALAEEAASRRYEVGVQGVVMDLVALGRVEPQALRTLAMLGCLAGRVAAKLREEDVDE